MKIELLKFLVPSEYQFRKKFIDQIFSIIEGKGPISFTMGDIVKNIQESQTKVDRVILYFLANDYLNRSGSDSKPSFILTLKGQNASIDREFLRTGRNERYKTIGLVVPIVTVVASAVGYGSSWLPTPNMDQRHQNEETSIPQTQQLQTAEEEPQIQQTITLDSPSLSIDSVILGTSDNENPNP